MNYQRLLSVKNARNERERLSVHTHW